MPDSGLLPPLDASQYPGYLDLLKKQQIAQTLMQGFQQGNQTPASWNSMTVVPRKSVFSTVANLAEGLGAGYAAKDAMKAQRNYLLAPYQGMLAAQATPGSSPAGAAPKVAPLTAQMPPQSGGGLVPPTQQPPAAPQQPNPMYLTGDPMTSNRLYQMMGPAEYGKALAGKYAPTDLEKQLRAAGIDPESPQGRQALVNAVNKAGFIEPIGGARPGTIAFDPITHQPLFAQPDVSHNVNLGVGPDGVTASAIPGNAAAQAELEGQTEAAKTGGQYHVLPTQGGGSTVVGPGVGGPQRIAPKVGQPTSGPRTGNEPQGWASMPKLPVAGGLGAPNSYVEGQLKNAGAVAGELGRQYGNEANLADQKLQYNQDARAVLDQSEVGPSSEWLTENRAKLLEWGVPESLVPGSGKVTPTLELNKVLKQSALQGARQIFGSRMTQMEVKLQHEELSPSPSMTREAILSLMKQDDIKQQYAKQRAEDFGQYIEKGGDPTRFESWYSKNFSLGKFAKEHGSEVQTTPAAAAPTAKPNFTAEEIQAELKRRGLNGR